MLFNNGAPMGERSQHGIVNLLRFSNFKNPFAKKKFKTFIYYTPQIDENDPFLFSFGPFLSFFGPNKKEKKKVV